MKTIKYLFSFKGTMTGKNYFWLMVITFLIDLSFKVVMKHYEKMTDVLQANFDHSAGAAAILFLVFSIIGMMVDVIRLAAITKRIRDIGWNAWTSLALIIPMLTLSVVIENVENMDGLVLMAFVLGLCSWSLCFFGSKKAA